MGILDNEPTCKKCNCLYPVEWSKHEDYCDECFIAKVKSAIPSWDTMTATERKEWLEDELEAQTDCERPQAIEANE